jgi:dTDP-4-dehydrorhamnose reductase
MRVLITGASGLLGRHLIKSHDPLDEILGVVRSNTVTSGELSCETRALDLTNFHGVREVTREFAPEVIIHTAAEGRVDAVQGRPQDFRKLNVDLPLLLSDYAVSSGTQFIHLSSNAVFGGRTRPYSDISRPDPINDYGVLKAEAEKLIESSNSRALTVRPILMYGWPGAAGRQNPVTTWVNELREGRRIRVVDDVWTEPLAAWDCAEAIWKAVKLNLSGPLNVSSGETLSLMEFAMLVAETFNFDPSLIDRASIQDFPNLAPRPRYTSFDLERLKGELRYSPLSPLEGLLQLRHMEPPVPRYK